MDHAYLHQCTILCTKVLEHIDAVLTLGQGNLVCGVVALNINTKESVGRSQVT